MWTKEKGKVYVWNNHTNKVELILENHFQDKDASYNVDYENDCFYVYKSDSGVQYRKNQRF